MNLDPAFEQLLPYLKAQADENLLWVADENLLDSVEHVKSWSADTGNLTVISNRFDVAQRAQQAGLDCSFSDFDFSSIDDASIDTVVYRVSKEKPVVNHIINQAFRCLKKQGRLIIAGEKSDGCKTYIDKASRLFGKKVPAKKNGSVYTGIISKFTDQSCEPLDDKNYTQLREIFELNNTTLVSKPGIFGWNKEDKGSALLIETTSQYLKTLAKPPASLLDLGCGYGYLTLASRQWPNITTRAATDNNAASIMACEENSSRFDIEVQVSADDCGSRIQQSFDLILCNPPFHQGFSVDNSLTHKFLNNTQRLLNQEGVALFVVNQFIDLEKKASSLFSDVKLLTSDGQFKIIALRH